MDGNQRSDIEQDRAKGMDDLEADESVEVGLPKLRIS